MLRTLKPPPKARVPDHLFEPAPSKMVLRQDYGKQNEEIDRDFDAAVREEMRRLESDLKG